MGDYSGRFDTLYWSPAEVRDLASNLATWGKEVEDNIKQAYTTVEQMGRNDIWTGYWYNQLGELMNDQKGYFQTAMRIIVEEIPTALNETAKTQAEGSNASFSSFSAQSIDTSYEITYTADDGSGKLLFNEESVAAANKEFTTYLSTATERLNKYKNDFDSLFNAVLSARAKAFQPYKSLVERTVAECTSKFTTFCDSYVKCAENARSMISAADTNAANPAGTVSQA